MKKICSILLILVLVICAFSTVANGFAAKINGELTTLDGTGGIDAADNSVKTVMGSVMTVARIIAVTVAVLMLLVIAMKYMLAAPGEKADMKKSMVAYVVGAIVVLGATGILSIISKFSTAIKK